ncbi:YhdT family protein [Oceanisphaera ostreae]|uniref:YhdT family protein n=1 Tax=Oceanisphaera ostreae TaxID=914151 RepID=A0ABW3KI58_9GAMM
MNKIVTIARREALLSVVLAVLYMLGWWLSAYIVSPELTLGGWPLWFVLSCLFNPLLFIGLCVIMVRYCFKTVELDSPEPATSPNFVSPNIKDQVNHRES